MEEKLPVSSELKVIESINIYKTNKWWSSVALIESFGRKQIAVYLWTNKNGEWKRKQKFVIHGKEEWLKVKDAIERLLPSLI
ncbi:MAG: hypothetical protein QW265_00060 [Candidatus Bathyarchaeia archaeon]